MIERRQRKDGKKIKNGREKEKKKINKDCLIKNWRRKEEEKGGKRGEEV